MSTGAPWSVKGIDPKAREIAKDLARRSGMTLGEWLNQVILEGDGEEAEIAAAAIGVRRAPAGNTIYERNRVVGRGWRDRRFEDEAAALESVRAVSIIEEVSSRIEAAERRSTLAISGVDQAVAGVIARFDDSERSQADIARRVETVAEELRSGHERLLRLERLNEGRTPEAVKALETALGKIANQIYEGEARTRAVLGEMREELTSTSRRLTRIEAEARETDAAVVVEDVVSRIAARLERAETETAAAIRALDGSFAALEERLRATEAGVDPGREARFERLTSDLSRRIDESRAELINRLLAMGDGRITQLDETVEAVAAQVQAAEQRSARAIERMGAEVLRIADNLNRRMTGVETASAEAVTRIGEDMARMTDAVDVRLRKAETGHGEALERLGQEIAVISERFAERIAQSERRTAISVDQVGARLDRVADKLEARYDRASGEIAERIRQSEDRTARLLQEAREKIERQLDGRRRAAESAGLAPERIVEVEAPASIEVETLDQVAPEEISVAAKTDSDRADEPGAPEAPVFVSLLSAGSRFGMVSSRSPQQTASTTPPPVVVIEPQPPASADMEPVDGLDIADADPFEPSVETEIELEIDDAFATERRRGLDARFDDELAEIRFAPGADRSDPFAVAEDVAPEARELSDIPDFGGIDPFDAETANKPPVSTREALDAARAAARLGVRNAPESDGAAFTLLRRTARGAAVDRIDRRRKGRDGSTMKKAMLASATAATVMSALAGWWYIFADDEAARLGGGGEASALKLDVQGEGVDESGAPILAPALSTGGTGSDGDAIDAAALYEEASRMLAANEPEALSTLVRAANLGWAPAQFHLAKLYEGGESGVPRSGSDARKWTERAAQGGDRRAMHNLGMYYFDGVGGPKDLTVAAQWFRKAAEQGLVDSQYNLGRLYEQGLGAPQDEAEAYRWYLIAADAGDAEARIAADRVRDALPVDLRLRAERAAARFKPTEADTTILASR